MYPRIDPADPASIARWEASEFNALRSKIEVVNLRCFREKMTERGHSESKPVPIEICGALKSGAVGEQTTALRLFKESELDLYAKARAAVYDEYRESYGTYKRAWSMGVALYGGSNTNMQSVLPEIVKGNELDGLISFSTIYVLSPKDGASRVGIVLNCPWDEEHGMGIVIANGEVEDVGDAGVVYGP
jgi:hypothetical protein